MATIKISRVNYYKYFHVQERLVQYLEAGISAKDAAKDLGISIPTFYKYKCIASLENKKLYTTLEEKVFMETLQQVAEACTTRPPTAAR